MGWDVWGSLITAAASTVISVVAIVGVGLRINAARKEDSKEVRREIREDMQKLEGKFDRLDGEVRKVGVAVAELQGYFRGVHGVPFQQKSQDSSSSAS